MRIFLDCNVLLDVGLQREPFYHTSSQLLDYLEIHKNIGCIAWHSLATFYYIAAKSKNQPLAKQFISDLCQFIYVVPTTNSDLLIALTLPISDFEDAMQCAAAMNCEATFIVTRNLADYQNAPIQAVTPEQVLTIMIGSTSRLG